MKKILLFNKHIVKRRKPVNFKENHSPIFIKEIERSIPKIYYTTLNNVCINHDEFFWKKYRLLKQSFFKREKRKSISIINRVKFLMKQLISPKTEIKKGLWIIDPWSVGYFHWFCDVLQRYHFFNFNEKQEFPILLPSSYKKINYVKESIEYLNLSVIYIKHDEIIKVKRLITIPYKLIMGNYVNSAIVKLRSSLFSKLKVKNRNKCEKIYISRSKAERRKIKNENQLIPVLKKHHFEIIHCEDFSWKEQFYLFNNAKFLVSNHGAGLTNQLFMKEKTTLIEIRGKRSCNQNCYFSLSSEIDINYYYLIGEQENLADAHMSDITVNPEHLDRLLKRFVK